MVFGALGLDPLGPAPTAGTLLPPPQNFHGEVRGYQELSRAKQTGQYKTRQDSPPGPDRQDRTRRQESPPGPDRHDRTSHQGKTDRTRRQESPPGPDRQDTTTGKPSRARQTRHPTGTRSPPGLARRLRLPLGMIRSQGPSATASTSATRGQTSLHGQDKTR